jgi:hypothetical protein
MGTMHTMSTMDQESVGNFHRVHRPIVAIVIEAVTP